MSTKGAEQWASNPIGKAMDQAGLGEERRKYLTLKVGDYKLDGTAIASSMATGNPMGYIGQGVNAVKTTEERRQVGKAQRDLADAKAEDEKKFQDFKAQEQDLLANGASTELFVPQYKVGKRKAETDALAQIFQARKDQAIQRQARPGISQTRTGAL